MPPITSRDIAYEHEGTRLLGLLCAPQGAVRRPTVVLVHDAFGLGEDMIAIARRLAGRGFAVFAADVWGERMTPRSEPEIGPLIGGMVGNRDRWISRIAAAHEVAAAQPEVDGDALVSLGYCFGGSSALEYVRSGGAVRAAIGIHPGLDLVEFDWSGAHQSAVVLICTGADDPMATAEMRAQLQQAMSGAAIDWELDLYSGTKHAFTSPKAQFSPMPEVVAYHPRNAERAWQATTRLLDELFPELHPGADATPVAGD